MFLMDGFYYYFVGCWFFDINLIVFCSSWGENLDLLLIMDVFILYCDIKKVIFIIGEIGYFY